MRFPVRPLLLTLLGLLVLWVGMSLASIPAQAVNEPTEFNLWLDGRLVGGQGDLSPQEREVKDHEMKGLQTNRANNLEDIANWSIRLGEKMELERDAAFKLHFNTTSIHELEAVLYYSYRDQEGETHDLGELGATGGPGRPQTTSGDVVLEASGNLDSQLTIPAGSLLWVRIDYNLLEAPGNEDANIFWDSQAKDSYTQHTARMVFFEDDLTQFDNQRVDEGKDKLYIEVNLTSAFGAVDIGLESGDILIEGVNEGGDVRSIEAVGEDYRVILSGYWHYQDDKVEADTYTFTFSIQDSREGLWYGTSSYELEVDFYDVLIELDTSEETDTKQVSKRESASFFFVVTNQGNSLDDIRFKVDNGESRIPSGWNVSLMDYDGPYSVPTGETVSGSVEITPDSSVPGGSQARVVIRTWSDNDDSVYDELEVTVRMQSYGVQLWIKDSENYREIPFLDPEVREGGYRFRVMLQNKGNDRDEFKISATCTRTDWLVTLLQNDNTLSSVTLDAQERQELEVKVELNNENNEDEASVNVTAYSAIDPDAKQTLTIDLIALVPLEEVINIKILEETIDVDSTVWSGKGELTIMVSLFNEGGKDAGPFQVQLFEGNILKDTVDVDGLSAQETDDIELKWANPKEGTVEITINVDPRRFLNEASRADNIASAEFEITIEADSGDDDDDSPGVGLVLTALALVGMAAVSRSRRQL